MSHEPKLMGVGAMLMPTATGWRNIYIGCLALGMDRDELDERIEEIGAFTDLGEALDRPLRTYSSGMKARLHFSIATSMRPRILLIDEALAVGDRRFREKSAGRIESMLADAGTLHARQPLAAADKGPVRLAGCGSSRASCARTAPSTR